MEGDDDEDDDGDADDDDVDAPSDEVDWDPSTNEELLETVSYLIEVLTFILISGPGRSLYDNIHFRRNGTVKVLYL